MGAKVTRKMYLHKAIEILENHNRKVFQNDCIERIEFMINELMEKQYAGIEVIPNDYIENEWDKHNSMYNEFDWQFL